MEHEHSHVFVRHSAPCKRTDKLWRKCDCRKYIYISDRKRITAKTRSWATAEALLRKLQGVDGEPVSLTHISVADAVKRYIQDKKQQSISKERIGKLTVFFQDRMLSHANDRLKFKLEDLTLSDMEDFRATWIGEPITNKKKQENLSAFFSYAVRHDWLKKNPVFGMSKIKVKQVPTDYFPQDEFRLIMDACATYHPLWRKRITAIVLLLRWSGLRIGDVIGLQRNRLVGSKVMLYTSKTGQHVYVPLPPEAVDALKAYDNGNPKYFFWSGKGLVKSAVSDARRSIYRLFDNSGLSEKKRCHPHMFRDTFAVELLLADVHIDQVSLLLGHSSVKTTERSYAPFVKARQVQLESSVQKAWAVQGAGANPVVAINAKRKRA